MDKMRLHIFGMYCGKCVYYIKKAVNKLPGIKNVSINKSTGIAMIEYDEWKVDVCEVTKTIELLGYNTDKSMFCSTGL
jgi:copper chaperone CopZ